MLHANVHEPKEIIAYLQQRAEVKVSNFTPGDYVIGNGMAIERKTTNDFIRSLLQKRLLEQLQRLKSCYSTSFLLLETFDLAYFQNSTMIYGTLLTIMLELNVRVLFTSTKEQSAEVILLLARKQLAVGRPRGDSEGSGGNRRNGERSGNNRRNDEGSSVVICRKEVPLERYPPLLLEKVPGVGKKRASALLDKFKSLQAVFEASEQELGSVEGVGKKTANNIKVVWTTA